jgi:hypothetical protein
MKDCQYGEMFALKYLRIEIDSHLLLIHLHTRSVITNRVINLPYHYKELTLLFIHSVAKSKLVLTISNHLKCFCTITFLQIKSFWKKRILLTIFLWSKNQKSQIHLIVWFFLVFLLTSMKYRKTLLDQLILTK